ncbi:hypothetical protein T484DRAFT_3427395 [Baffinella frigidus]|nr:hypothetical protein T484DRAFT_3427395 [Cryptophyta sp. CCMP2293]
MRGIKRVRSEECEAIGQKDSRPCHERLRSSVHPEGRCRPRSRTEKESHARHVRRVLRIKLWEEATQQCWPTLTDPTSKATLCPLRRHGIATLFELASTWGISTSSPVFGASVSLLHRSLSSPSFESPANADALPFACFNIALKFEDGAAPLLDILCVSLGEGRIDADAVTAVEIALLTALSWQVDHVTPAHLLAQLSLLCPPAIWASLLPDIRTTLEIYYAVHPTP